MVHPHQIGLRRSNRPWLLSSAPKTVSLSVAALPTTSSRLPHLLHKLLKMLNDPTPLTINLSRYSLHNNIKILHKFYHKFTIFSSHYNCNRPPPPSPPSFLQSLWTLSHRYTVLHSVEDISLKILTFIDCLPYSQNLMIVLLPAPLQEEPICQQ